MKRTDRIDLGKSVRRIKEDLQAQGTGRLACDIDDTIAKTSDAYHDLLSRQFPPPEALTKDSLRKHYALTGRILHWGDIPEANAFAYEFIDDPHFHAQMDPLDGAIAGTQELWLQQRLACYLTVRSEAMRSETECWFSRYDLPTLPLAMRDAAHSASNAQWKAAALEYLFPEVQGIIDNDARIARLLEEQGYRGKVFLLGLNEHEYAPSNIVTPIEDWAELTRVILDMFPE